MKVKKVKVAALALAAAVMIGGLQAASPTGQANQGDRSVWSGVYTEEQAKRGQALYGSECVGCHGGDLDGVDEAPALSGGSFLGNWDGLTLGDLSERIRISMPPTKPGKLSRQQVADLVSYILSVNHMPAGKEELNRETEMLKQIKIVATKPDGKSGTN